MSRPTSWVTSFFPCLSSWWASPTVFIWWFTCDSDVPEVTIVERPLEVLSATSAGACALTSLTTAIGFGSLMISDYQMMSDFGRQCAIGVSLTFLSIILIIPTLSATWLGERIHFGMHRDLVARHAPAFGRVVDWSVARRRWVAGAGVLLTLVLAIYSLNLQPDDRFRDKVPHTSEAYQAMQFCDREFGGVHVVQVLVDWTNLKEFSNEKLLTAIGEVESLATDLPDIEGVLSIRTILSAFPGKWEGAKLATASLIPHPGLRSFWRADRQQALVLMRTQDYGVAHYAPILERFKQGLKELEKKHPGMRFEISGRTIALGETLRRLITDLTRSLGMAGAIILVVMGVMYRSWKIGLVAIFPNLFPLVVTAAVRTASVGTLEIASACSFTICLGIAVDDTIHFLSRYRREVASGVSLNAALRKHCRGRRNGACHDHHCDDGWIWHRHDESTANSPSLRQYFVFYDRSSAGRRPVHLARAAGLLPESRQAESEVGSERLFAQSSRRARRG